MELKAALVGCGAMSRAWLRAAAKSPDLRIVGLADLDVERAKGRAAEFSLKDVVIAKDVHELLSRAVRICCSTSSFRRRVTKSFAPALPPAVTC